jgi:hypothetical protein
VPYTNAIAEGDTNQDVVSVSTDLSAKESVSDLNGLAIPAMLEVKALGTCSLYSILRSDDVLKNMHRLIRDKFNRLKEPSSFSELPPPEYFVELAALYMAAGNPSRYRSHCIALLQC